MIRHMYSYIISLSVLAVEAAHGTETTCSLKNAKVDVRHLDHSRSQYTLVTSDLDDYKQSTSVSLPGATMRRQLGENEDDFESHHRFSLDSGQRQRPPRKEISNCWHYMCPPICRCTTHKSGCPARRCDFATHTCVRFEFYCDWNATKLKPKNDYLCVCYKHVVGYACIQSKDKSCSTESLMGMIATAQRNITMTRNMLPAITFLKRDCFYCKDLFCNEACSIISIELILCLPLIHFYYASVLSP